MTRFLDVRLNPVGGGLATMVNVMQGTDISTYVRMDTSQLIGDVFGRHVLIGTHGFNVDRASGIAALSNWERLLHLPDPSLFVGVLWPGDSTWAHGLDYPEEPRIANEAGKLIAAFIESVFVGAASVSFASHSLGARLVLETISQLVVMRARRVVLMAGAIDDDCLTTEFKTAVTRIGEISVLASQNDEVLSALFPLGNFLGGILTVGHPWLRTALGRWGPRAPAPANFQAPFQIPDKWQYGHGDYLRIAPSSDARVSVPVNIPSIAWPLPASGAAGWQSAFSAAFVATRFE